MSYCRWSCMDSACDLHIYESSDGFVVHVARNRVQIDRTTLPPITAVPGTPAWVAQYLAREEALGALLEDCPRTKIDHPAAGKSFCFDTPAETIEYLKKLRTEGLTFPDHVIPDLEKES